MRTALLAVPDAALAVPARQPLSFLGHPFASQWHFNIDVSRFQLLSSLLIHAQQMVQMTPLLFSG